MTKYSSRFVDRDMFARFGGFGPGHKSTRLETKVFQDEIKEVFAAGDGRNDMGEELVGIEVEPDHGDLEPDRIESEDEGGSDGDSDSKDGDLWDNREELGYFAFEEVLGYAPL